MYTSIVIYKSYVTESHLSLILLKLLLLNNISQNKIE